MDPVFTARLNIYKCYVLTTECIVCAFVVLSKNQVLVTNKALTNLVSVSETAFTARFEWSLKHKYAYFVFKGFCQDSGG